MAFNDRELTCRDCGGAFVFTAGEQEFYATKGLQNDPVRCPSCRASRKLMRPEDREETTRYGVYASWGGRTPRQLHVATCSGCNKSAEVPFAPRGDRPVFCSECYNEERKRQEAHEQAATEMMARLASDSGSSTSAKADFEGAGRDASESEAGELTADAEPAEDAEVASTAELTADAEPAEDAEVASTAELTADAEPAEDAEVASTAVEAVPGAPGG